MLECTATLGNRVAVTSARSSPRRPLRVLHLVANLEIGGAQEVIRSIVPALRVAGCLPVVATFRDGPLRTEIERSGVPVHVIAGRRRALAGDPRAVAELARIRRDLAQIVDSEGIDVVQSHLLRSLDFLLLTLPRRAGRPHIVWTFHNARLDLRPDQLPGRRWLLGAKRRGYRLLYRLASRRVAAMVAVSDDVAAAIRDQIRPARGRLVVIANGVDLGRYAGTVDRDAVRLSAGLPVDGLLAVCVAKLHEQKGHRFLIDALAAARDELGSLHVALIGTGPLRDEIARRVEAAGLTNTVHLLGERKDVADILRASDLFLLPSLWEGLPMALLEAMASGLPVIATGVSGTRDVVSGPADGGILVPPGDPAALAAALRTLVADGGRRKAMGEAAQRRVTACFGVAAQAQAYAALYRACVAAGIEQRA